MEAVVLLGLVGAGYLFNKQNEDNNPVNKAVNKDISMPSGDNLYNSDFYNETDKMIRNLGNTNFESSHTEGSSVINHQKLNRIGSDLNKPLNDPTPDVNDAKEGFDNFTYSSASGGYIPRNDFMSNDQGIKAEPYFSRAPTAVNFDDPRRLNALNGDTEFYKSKRETKPFFNNQKDLTNVFGNTFGEGMGDKKRYDSGLLRTNELPFTQERIQHIDVKSDFNREIDQMIAEKTNIDVLRSESNPKLTFKGKVLAGKNINESRGKQGVVFQHNPDKFYENNPDKWFVTNGAYLERAVRPGHIIPETNRQFLNRQPIGGAAPAIKEGHEKRQGVRKPLRQQLGSDTIRNTGVEISQVGTDLQHKGYRALPNERDVTTLRNYTSNLTTDEKAPEMSIQDVIRKTVKETTIN